MASNWYVLFFVVCFRCLKCTRRSTRRCSWTRWFRTTKRLFERWWSVSSLHFNTKALNQTTVTDNFEISQSTALQQPTVVVIKIENHRHQHRASTRRRHTYFFELLSSWIHPHQPVRRRSFTPMKTFRVGWYLFFDFFFNMCSLDHRFLLTTFIAFPVFPFFVGCTHVHVSFRTMVCYVMVFFIACDPTEFSVSSFSVN